MRICLVTRIFPPDIGGPSLQTKLIAESLAEGGRDVCVVTCESESPSDLHLTAGADAPIDVYQRDDFFPFAEYQRCFFRSSSLTVTVQSSRARGQLGCISGYHPELFRENAHITSSSHGTLTRSPRP